jgi:hypothetical protein
VGPRTGLDDVERRNILHLPGLELPLETLSTEVKRQGHEDDHSPPSWVEVRDSTVRVHGVIFSVPFSHF